MALSEQEQRMLAEIESALYAEDPKFGSAMSGKSMGLDSGGTSRGFSPRVIAIIGVGLLLLIGGMALANISLWFVTLSVVGFLAMFGAGVWALTGTGVRAGALAAAIVVASAIAFMAGARTMGLSAPRAAGGFAGYIGQPAILAFANERVDDDRIEAGYAALFALGIIAKILAVQVIGALA